MRGLNKRCAIGFKIDSKKGFVWWPCDVSDGGNIKVIMDDNAIHYYVVRRIGLPGIFKIAEDLRRKDYQ